MMVTSGPRTRAILAVVLLNLMGTLLFTAHPATAAEVDLHVTTVPAPDPQVTPCCRLAESGGGSAGGGEEAHLAAWVIGLPGGGVQAPPGTRLVDCTPWTNATGMPDIPGAAIAGDMRVDPDGVLAFLYQRDCEPGPVRQFVWVRQESPESIARAALENLQIRLLPAPVPILSPPTHSIVHLPTWLAVAPQGAHHVTADIPSMWVTATAKVSSTTFDVGDGIVITCAGTGAPRPAHAAESTPPCGHTFTAVDRLGRGRTVRVHTTWSVTWHSSWGASGTLDPVVSATRVLPHPVREVQTIGQRG